MIQRISNCYDSHTHFMATGQVASGLQLQGLKSPKDLSSLAIQDSYYRGDWLTGFGWDQNQWSTQQFPHRQDLDLIFKDCPVFLSRVDGHASWINSLGLKLLGEKGLDLTAAEFKDYVVRDAEGQPNGVLLDQAHIQALALLPDFTPGQKTHFLVTAQKIFNQAGFTHIRDLSMNLETWALLSKMHEQKNLTVCLDSFVTAENLADVARVIREVQEIKKNPCSQLRVHGVKIFVDGSLGSRTAFLSENYLGTDQAGLLIWKPEDIVDAMKKTWGAGLEIAVHCIGDQAVHTVVQSARVVSAQGILGRLHLEHVEILRSETVQLMKPLHVICYMQPSHWLSDHDWLAKSVAPDLLKNIFQWELLRKNKIPVFFGSDSPIEKASLFSTQKALLESAKQGVPALQADWKKYHSHPDVSWTHSWTEFDEEKVSQVYFNAIPLL